MSDGAPVGRVDERIDGAFAALRGQPRFDRAASTVSNLADYGFVWVVLAGLKGRRSGRDRRRAVVALGAAGVSSLVVSRLAKRVVERQRPEDQVAAMVRTPTSSSFPSGHTLAAFCTAVVLPESPGGTTACVAFATAVALSRVHLRAHHATDVIGGAVIGSVLGMGLRPVVNWVTPGTRRARKGMGKQGYLLERL